MKRFTALSNQVFAAVSALTLSLALIAGTVTNPAGGAAAGTVTIEQLA